MLSELLAPYWEESHTGETDDEGYPYNPQGKWDWWVLGGRWRGQLSVADVSAGYRGTADTFGSPPVHEHYLDATTRGNVVNDPSDYIHGVLAEGVWRDGSPDVDWSVDRSREQVQALFAEADQRWREWIDRFWAGIPAEQWLALVDYHS
jgi:hypothetical protein